jgi:pentatricopeptide repeat protein
MLKLLHCCAEAGRLEEAVGVHEDLLAFRRHTVGDRDLARGLAAVANSYSALGLEQKALDLHNQAFQLLCKATLIHSRDR